MKIKTETINGVKIAEVISDNVIISEPREAVEVIAECGYLGSCRVIIHDRNMASAFFETKTKMAGKVLQKFTHHQVKLAIVGDFSRYPDKGFKDLIIESNKRKQICFVNTLQEGIEAVSHDD